MDDFDRFDFIDFFDEHDLSETSAVVVFVNGLTVFIDCIERCV